MKTINYLVTATELNEMALLYGYTTKNGITGTAKANTKSEAGAAYYLDENANPWITYIPNRCPRFEDYVCAPSGLSVTVDTVSVYDETHTNPVYNSYYSYLFKIKATTPQVTPTVIFDITLPNNILLGSFRYVHYNGSAVPLPTSNYYYIDIYQQGQVGGRVKITLFQQVTTEYEIAFNAAPIAQYGTFTATGYASGTWCNTTSTASGTNSYQLLIPNVTVSKAVVQEYQVNCLTVKEYNVTVSNTGGKLIGGTLSDTLPTGLTLDQFGAVFYNGAPVPYPTSDYYDLSTYQQGVNGGQVVLQLFKDIGNGNYYDLYFYAKNNGGTSSYTNTAVFQNGTYATSGSNTSNWPTAPSTTYYEVQNCVTSAYLYTSIAPTGASNRYILPASANPYYIYTGSSLVQCNAPAGYNPGFIQTAYYGCCTTAPNWIVSGYTCNGTCNKTEILYDDNPCSSTFGDTIPGNTEYNSAYCYVPGGAQQCCGQSTSPTWSNNGATDCFGSCTLYQPQINTNPCYTGSPQTQNYPLGINDACGTWVGQEYCQGCNKWYKEINSCTQNVRNDHEVQSNSTFCGGCCGQSTTPNWQVIGSTCEGCAQYELEYDENNCSSTPPPRTRLGALINANSSFCYVPGGNCCGQSQGPAWVNDGDPYCFDCHLYQPQINTNVCYTGSPQTQDVDLGPNTGCGSWYTVYYCPNYGVAPYEQRSKQLNTCVPGAVQNDQFVTNDSPSCGYVPPVVCKQYQIVAIDPDQTVDGTYTNCAGFGDSFSFYGGPGTVGYVCAQPSSVYVTTGNGYPVEVGNC